MNCNGIFNNILRKGINPFLTSTATGLIQQTRNTFILKRRFPLPQYKKNARPGRFKSKNFIYDLIENTNIKKKAPIEIILTTYVDGVGEKGDKMTMAPMKAYNNFLLPGLAVYALPENIQKYMSKEEKKQTFSSPYASRTINILSQFLLNVVMSLENPWTLEKWHVRAAFRRTGIHLNDDCITMPERPISGPNPEIENKEFYVTVTLNKKEKVNVRCRIHHWSNNASKTLPYVPQFFLKPSESIFPEDKPLLDSLPLPYLMAQAMQRANTSEQIN